MSGLKERKRVTLLSGKTMNLNLRDCDVDLAICVSELLYKIDKNDTIIIENFDDSEYEELKIVIRGAIRSGKKVLFYVPNNEENVTGLADELDMPVCMYDGDIEEQL